MANKALVLFSALTRALDPHRAAPRAHRIAVWTLLLALFVGLRTLAITADPPRRMFHGGLGNELFVEPTAKAHEARNWARFGSFKVNEADNYQFWRAQAPAWVYPLALSFRTFGTTYLTLRATAVGFGALGFLALVALMGRKFGGQAAFLLAVLLAIDSIGIFHGRSGLLEPIVSSWLAVAIYFLDRSLERAFWVVGAAFFLIVAFLTKQAALPAVPIFFAYGLWVFYRMPGTKRPWLGRLLVAGLVASMAAALGVYMMRDDYQRALAWNLNHVVMGRSSFGEVELDDVVEDGFGSEDWVKFGLRAFRLLQIYPFLLPMGWLEVARQIIGSIRTRRISGRSWLPALWFLAFFFAALLPADFLMRFTLPMTAPAALCGVSVLVATQRWLLARARPRLALLPIVGAMAAIGYQGAGIGYVLAKRSYIGEQIRVSLEEHIGPDPNAVVIGLWSAPLVFETPYKHYYVKNEFNATREALEKLKPTHLLLMPSADYTRSILQSQWPQLLDRARTLDAYQVRGHEVILSDVRPLRIRVR